MLRDRAKCDRDAQGGIEYPGAIYIDFAHYGAVPPTAVQALADAVARFPVSSLEVVPF